MSTIRPHRCSMLIHKDQAGSAARSNAISDATSRVRPPPNSISVEQSTKGQYSGNASAISSSDCLPANIEITPITGRNVPLPKAKTEYLLVQRLGCSSSVCDYMHLVTGVPHNDRSTKNVSLI